VLGFRPEPSESQPAEKLLEKRGHTMTEYLRACLLWLNADPDAALATLAPVWPEPRRKGRPPKAEDDAASSDDVADGS